MKESITYLDVTTIHPNPYQPRREFDQRKLEELAESIDVQGLIQPIIVREVINEEGGGTHYEIIAGERRLRAVRDILQKPRIKAIVSKEFTTDNQSEEAALVENIQRENLNPMDEVRAIIAIMEREDLTQEQVAKRLGKSRSEISNLVRLMKLPKDIQTLVAQGQIEKTKAWKIATLPDEAKQKSIAHKCIEHDWNFAKLRDEVDKVLASTKTEKAKKVPRTPLDKPKKSDLSRYVLVEFDEGDIASVNEFLAYMVEQGFKCHIQEAIMEVLKSGAPAKPPVPEPSEPDIFSTLNEEADLSDECLETAEFEHD